MIMARESGPRTNASSARQNRGPKRWSINKGSDPKNLVEIDKHCKDVRLGEALKYLERKLLPSH